MVYYWGRGGYLAYDVCFSLDFGEAEYVWVLFCIVVCDKIFMLYRYFVLQLPRSCTSSGSINFCKMGARLAA